MRATRIRTTRKSAVTWALAVALCACGDHPGPPAHSSPESSESSHRTEEIADDLIEQGVDPEDARLMAEQQALEAEAAALAERIDAVQQQLDAEDG